MYNILSVIFYYVEIGPLETYRILIISVPTVLGTLTIFIVVGALYGFIKVVSLVADIRKQNTQAMKQSLLY